MLREFPELTVTGLAGASAVELLSHACQHASPSTVPAYRGPPDPRPPSPVDLESILCVAVLSAWGPLESQWGGNPTESTEEVWRSQSDVIMGALKPLLQ
ncbi:hypothetical protein SKAU_G00360880 [Synaphobranchus kaupii]|uniref:Uncharacterized protein n=1 Tax=Synaphobranchus kaupii TaxID=118154 RepID=A0A9Q1IGV8_SYNKA|nr:hypothetical protein SKAU_G00360880 [Synaphobranchus kaupii]